ncbi:MAG: hypothetical protein ACI4PC_06160, partial [Oscillospiraceae bacterium]
AGYGLATLQPRFIFGALYLFLINTLFIALSAALITVILRVPIRRSLSAKRQKRINRTVALITVIVVIPSLFIGAYTVYSSVMERNIQEYLNREFVFENTQLVQSSTDTQNRRINVSLVGQPISEEAIARLEQELEEYSLTGYTLHVTQNSISAADVDNADKITIAIQENTISELREQLTQQQARLEELESSIAAQLDFNALARKAESIFPALTDCSCGITADGSSESIILAAHTQEELTEAETAVLENWLRAESGLDQVKLFISRE